MQTTTSNKVGVFYLTEKKMSGISVETVVRELGITPRTLRYYEEVGLVTPTARTRGGHRLYNQSSMDLLKQILRLKENLGFSLQEIRETLDAEQSLEALRNTFHQSNQNLDNQRSMVDRYIEVLRNLIKKMDTKIESVSTMRNMYKERLERSIRFREDEMETK